MSISNSGSNNSYDDVIAQLASRVEQLEAAVSDKDDRIDELEQRVDDQDEEIDDQGDTIDELEATVDELQDDLQETKDHSGKERAELSKRVSEVEGAVEEGGIDGGTPTPDGDRTGVQPSELTPIEQLSQAEDVSDVTDSPTVERAVSMFKNLPQWGSKTPKGIVLKPADNPLSLLEADQDESLAWKQYYRAAEALEQLSQGSVTFFDSDRHGKMICLHEQSEAFERVVNGTLTPSSVGAEG